MSNPIELLNARVADARAKAEAELVRIRRARQAFEKAGFTPAENMSPVELATAQAAHEVEKNKLWAQERNYRPSTAVLDMLDDAPDGKKMLMSALKFLKNRAASVPKPPKAEEIVPAHSAPVGGLFGTIEPIDLAKALAALEVEVEVFPDNFSFGSIVTMVNAVNSAIDALAEKAKPTLPAKRQDKPLAVWN